MRDGDGFGDIWSGWTSPSSYLRRWFPERTPLPEGDSARRTLAGILTRFNAMGWDRDEGGDGAQATGVIAVVGLRFEARILSRHGVRTMVIGPRRPVVALAPLQSCCGVVSFGVCGGLHPDLTAGDCVVASVVHSREGSWKTNRAWSERLLEATPEALFEPIVGVDHPIGHIEEKRELHRRFKAVAVDMESHIAASAAIENGLPFAAIRVVVDDAHCPLIPAALAARRHDGSVDAGAVLRAVWRSPGQLTALLRLAARTHSARATLLRLRLALGEDFALPAPDDAEVLFEPKSPAPESPGASGSPR